MLSAEPNEVVYGRIFNLALETFVSGKSISESQVTVPEYWAGARSEVSPSTVAATQLDPASTEYSANNPTLVKIGL